MPGLIAGLSVIILILIARDIIYRRQVKKLCRLLRFMNENKTMQ